MIKMSTLTLNKPPTYLMLTCVDIWLSTYLPPLVHVVFGRPLDGQLFIEFSGLRDHQFIERNKEIYLFILEAEP